MPTFDFACAKCKNVFEFTRPFGSKKIPVCPKCGNKKTEKLLSPPSVQFKGEGFYKTDAVKKPAPKKTDKPKTDTPKAPDPPAPKGDVTG